MNSEILHFNDKAEEKKHRRFFSSLGFSYILAYGLTNLLLVGIIYLMRFLDVSIVSQTNSPDFTVIVSSVLTLLYVISVPIMLRKSPRVKIVRRKISAGRFVSLLLIAIGTGTMLSILTIFYISVFSDFIGVQTQNVVTQIIDNANYPVVVLLTGFFAPILEEILFRKILCDRVVRYGERTAIFLSGFMFALFHGNLYQFFYTFGIGLVLAYMYCKTGKLRYSIIAHMVINLSAVVRLPLYKYADFEVGESVIAWQSILLVALNALYYVLSVVGIALLCTRIKKIKLDRGSISIPSHSYFRTVFLNFGMLTFMIFFIVVSITGVF